MQQLHQHIQATLKDVYRKAIDADANLDALGKQNQGKFQSIFKPNEGFTTSAKRFLPYVEELSEEFAQLQNLSEEELKQALPNFVTKLELILRTLANFNFAKKSN